MQFRAQPKVQQWHLVPPFDRTTRGFAYAENAYYQKTLRQCPPHQSLTERMRGLPQMGYAPVDELRAGVPESGWYQIRIRAEAKHRYADLDPKDPALDLRKQKFPSLWDPSEPIRLGIYTGTLEGIDPENKEALDTAATATSRASASSPSGICPMIRPRVGMSRVDGSWAVPPPGLPQWSQRQQQPAAQLFQSEL
ncbi:hypothetical protein [Verrucomicrobium spinosum]|uniref:hypothetical protein n=1 Tax=Verrucomicrobium spinosum TaxID=2736 RepID=UPI0012E16BAA|nr:hypothetical protein [Verrucomicrobium spinosum]